MPRTTANTITPVTGPVGSPASAPESQANVRTNVSAGNGNGNGQTAADENRSAFRVAMDRIERVKTNLRDILGDLNDAVSMLKTAERQQRGANKEVEAIRAKLREIQSVKI